jgi:hypothetical protein
MTGDDSVRTLCYCEKSKQQIIIIRYKLTEINALDYFSIHIC